MPVRELLTIGHPLLREKARSVPAERIATGEFRELVDELVDTMRAEGGIGIAAPQIGESQRVAVIEIEPGSRRYPQSTPFPLLVVVNPRISVVDPTEQGYWEGCLSVPNLRGLVYRPRAVRIDYVDMQGRSQSLVAEDFLATVFQHELDHLDGVLFIDKIRDTRRLATVENYLRFNLDENAGGESL